MKPIPAAVQTPSVTSDDEPRRSEAREGVVTGLKTRVRVVGARETVVDEGACFGTAACASCAAVEISASEPRASRAGASPGASMRSPQYGQNVVPPLSFFPHARQYRAASAIEAPPPHLAQPQFASIQLYRVEVLPTRPRRQAKRKRSINVGRGASP